MLKNAMSEQNNLVNEIPTTEALVESLAARLLERGAMLATAESCTGGGIAAACTDLAGSSAWFDRGFVTYSNLAKQQMLGVPEACLEQAGAVSELTVRAMAEGAVAHSQAAYSLAISGIAGPGGGSPDKPVGTVWFAWQGPHAADAQKILLPGDRAAVRAASIRYALWGLLQLLDREAP